MKSPDFSSEDVNKQKLTSSTANTMQTLVNNISLMLLHNNKTVTVMNEMTKQEYEP